jgi:hypothetical protein
MVVTNNVAYIAYQNDYTSLVMDVSNPAAPTLLDNLSWWCSVIIPSSNADRIYCLEDSNFDTLDVSNKYEESGVASFVSSGDNKIEEGVESGNLIVSFVQGGIHIASIVSAPTVALESRLGGDKVLNDPRGLDVQGNYAYVGTANGYLNIFDISNTSSATLISSTFMGDYDIDSVIPYELAVSGTYVYVAGADYYGTHIYDISNLASPKKIGELTCYNNLTNSQRY